MKKMRGLIKIVTVAFFAFSYHSVNAQKCGTDHSVYEQMMQNPNGAKQLQKIYEQAQNAPSGNKAPKIIIPVVVHVIHNNEKGNISLAQIQDGIDKINVDFNKLNGDTSQIRPVFASLAGRADVEFRLAKKDPSGQCTEGVTRVNSMLSYDKRNEVKALAQWDENRYFNVWLVNSIQSSGGTGTTLGYAQFPFSTSGASLNTYGIVVRHDEWGGIGTAQGGNGRTVTHEMGHCFNLLHTFQSGCGTTCSGSGDRICDTPPAANETFGCTKTNNTCSNDASGPSAFSSNVPDQLENYMSYDDCQYMFTTGQVNVMRATLSSSSYPWLQSLVSASNLIATGTNDGYVVQPCKPIAYMESPKVLKYACVGDTVRFTDNFVYNGVPTAYNWTFNGGLPSTSTAAQPMIVYNTAGTYDVTFAVSNPQGASSQFISGKVFVLDPNATNYDGLTYTENFESVVRVLQDYAIENPTGTTRWTRVGNVGYNSSSSMRLENNAKNGTTFTQAFGEVEAFTTPSIDMSNVRAPHFEFKIAYQKRATFSSDDIEIQTSFDCGKTWQNRWTFLNSQIVGSNGVSQGDFTPSSSSQWTTLEVNIFQGALNGQSDVRFKIIFNSRDGNNAYIDDIRVFGLPVGIEEQFEARLQLNLFPNPAKSATTLKFNVDQASNTTVYLTDLTGKRIQTIVNDETLSSGQQQFEVNTSAINSGIYLMTIEINGERLVKKLIVQ
jgi:PKD repeat protein